MIADVGQKIKNLRKEKGLTLKELSDDTSFSVGFLSQLERGLTTIAIDSLEKIAKSLNVELAYFIQEDRKKDKMVVIRSYEKEVSQVTSNQFIHYDLCGNKDLSMMPRLIEILPSKAKEQIKSYPHCGEEFLYVLEGILTLHIGGQSYDLFPGDSAHYQSTIDHNWCNNTNRIVKIITVHSTKKDT